MSKVGKSSKTAKYLRLNQTNLTFEGTAMKESSAKGWLYRALIGPAMIIDGLCVTFTLGMYKPVLGLKIARKLTQARLEFHQHNTTEVLQKVSAASYRSSKTHYNCQNYILADALTAEYDSAESQLQQTRQSENLKALYAKTVPTQPEEISCRNRNITDRSNSSSRQDTNDTDSGASSDSSYGSSDA